VFISVNDRDKAHVCHIAKRLRELGFELVATGGTRATIAAAGIDVQFTYKVNEGRPNVVDLIKSGQVQLIVNTPLGRASFYDELAIRRAGMQYDIPCITTITGAEAVVEAIAALQSEHLLVATLQEFERGRSRCRTEGA
jgi:carbamoyl-phosphate synthase large subunit